MKKIFACLLSFVFVYAYSQTTEYAIKGKIFSIDNAPIQSAFIQIDGSAKFINPDNSGSFEFSLPQGEHTLYIEAEGFAKKTITLDIQSNKDIGVIYLTNKTIELNEVVVKKKKLDPLKIEPGKKTYILANDPSIKGNNLVEVLQNVPSVNVDAEGNVSIRGNENATVLIDGKPSSLTGISSLAEALRSIPADMVEKIETITNPSSRYDASGSGGIINIVLKKEAKPGFYGSIETYVGNQANAGINLNLNYKKKKWNYFTTLSYQHFEPKGRTSINNNYLTESVIDSQQIQRAKTLKIRDNYTFRVGSDYNPNDKNLFSVSGIIKSSNHTNLNNINYDFYDSMNGLTQQLSRNQEGNQKEYTLEGNFGYKKVFDSDKHQLTIDTNFAYTNEEGENTIFERELFPVNELTSQTINPQEQIQKRFLLQSDYTQPFGENRKLNLGYRGTYKNITNDFRTDVLDINTNLITNNLFFTNSTLYAETVHAFYGELATKLKDFSLQLGLRSESTKINLSAATFSRQNFSYLDFFPSANLSYDFNNKNNLSFNYSRRIDRPNVRFLTPVSSAVDTNNVFSGNLALQPAYTNMFEMEWTKNLKTLTLSSAIYFSNSNGNFTIVRRLDSVNDIFIATPVNAEYENKFGLDLNAKWMKINTNFNLFQYKQKGTYFNENLNGEGFSWFGRLTSNVTLPKKILFNATAMYHGPNKTNNADRKGIFSLNLGLSKDVWKEKATISLNVNDLFNSFRRKITNFSDSFTSNLDLQFRQRQINLSFIYRFNGSKKEQTKKPTGEESMGDGGGF
jgi:outer membrane receptor for ferrienterochelin and colicins